MRRRRLGPAWRCAEAIRLLGEHGALEAELAESVAGAAGLRSALVHESAEIDDDVVVEYLGRIGELERFLAAVAERIGGA